MQGGIGWSLPAVVRLGVLPAGGDRVGTLSIYCPFHALRKPPERVVFSLTPEGEVGIVQLGGNGYRLSVQIGSDSQLAN